jgi:hypothetical protein
VSTIRGQGPTSPAPRWRRAEPDRVVDQHLQYDVKMSSHSLRSHSIRRG